VIGALNLSQMDARNGQGTRVNSFALVSYLTGPLAVFLDGLRHEIVPDAKARPHLTVLPPRPIPVSPDAAWREICEHLQEFEPLRVEFDDVAVFPGSQVIYIAVKTGAPELERMNRILNDGALAFLEPFAYHPHVTLAKDLPPGSIDESYQLACRRWREASVSREFVIDKLTFVQNTLENRWLDLDSVDLGTHVRL
jgi:2'-5' RNA ligase